MSSNGTLRNARLAPVTPPEVRTGSGVDSGAALPPGATTALHSVARGPEAGQGPVYGPGGAVPPQSPMPPTRPTDSASLTVLGPEAIRESLLEAVREGGAGGVGRIRHLAERVPPATLAEAIGSLPAEPLRQILVAVGPDRLAEVVAALDPAAAVDVLLRLTRPEAADVLDAMDPDDAADVVGELRDEDAPAAEQLLQEMERDEAADVRQLLSYPEDTAGGIMTTDFISVRVSDTVESAVRRLRAPGGDEVPVESASYVYVTEADGRLAGVVPWHRLVRAGARVPLHALLEPHTISVPATADQETVARVVLDHRLLAVPVVDDRGRVLGIVTADDVADVLEEETTEDIERLGGSQPLEEPYLRAGPFRLARKRVVWLLLLFLGAGYTGTVLQHFEADLASTVALAFFIPLLIGTGGNVGSQTVMTVIRALAIGEVGFRDLFRVWLKEATVGIVLGLVMGAATFGRAILLGVGPDVGVAVAVAAGVIVLWAATVAAILPLILHRLRIDPAVVSAPLITTLVDGTGLFLYLQTARFLLQL
jgi:magnesium transporter